MLRNTVRLPSLPSPLPTAPCPPQDVLALAGCENRTVSVSWAPSEGAVMYTATLEGTDGETTCCTTNDTSCDISQLPCGEMYVLLVTAEGRTCNSTQSEGLMVRTGEGERNARMMPRTHARLCRSGGM